MNGSTIFTVLRFELLMLYRDYRTLLLSVVLPILIMPILLSAAQNLQDRRHRSQNEVVYNFSVSGPLAEELRGSMEGLGGQGTPEFPFRELHSDDQIRFMRDGVIDIYLRTIGGTEADSHPTASPPRDSAARTGRSRLPGVPVVEIGFLGNQDRSIAARARMHEALNTITQRYRSRALLRAGMLLDPAMLLRFETRDVASDARLSGSMIGPYLTLMLVFLLLGGGSVAAMDILAGETERGSMETLLTTAASRRDIVIAKQLAVLMVALSIAAIQVVNILLFVKLRWVELPERFRLEMPLSSILLLAVLIVPLAALVAALLLYVSGRSRSFKESQLLFFPLFVVSTLLAAGAAIPDLQLRSIVALVPITSTALAIRDLVAGHRDLLMMLLTAFYTTGWAVVLVSWTTRALMREDALFSQSMEVSKRDRFASAVVTWFALIAAVMLVVPANLVKLNSLEANVLVTQGVVLCGCLLLIWRYQLPVKEALALRTAPWLVYPIALALAPAAQVAVNGLVLLTQSLLPVPDEMAREMTRLLLPEGAPMWKLILLLAVTPAICEELAFRGVLLYGLSRRLRPIPLTLAVSLMFGVFHMSIYRVLPTAATGIVITTLAISTGSIFPGMLLHFANNATAVWLHVQNVAVGELPTWVYLASLAVTVALLMTAARLGTPYPGLRASSRNYLDREELQSR